MMEVFENQTLNQILQAELVAGNEVVEKSAWPPKCKTLVILRSRFMQQHDGQSDIVYRVINDRHYWYAEYATEDGAECLACRF